MKFIDATEIVAKAGDGGYGMVSFMSAKGRAKLGPDGGDGGNGGDVILVAQTRLNTLSSLRYRQMYKAEPGAKGGTNRCTGRCGKHLRLPVPCGTVAVDAETGVAIGEVLEEGDELIIAKGGRRGLGNIHFVRANHQAPYETRPPTPGEEVTVKLELKLLADVGLAGFPNAGKSTLLSTISAARPKVANYPFTTLTPQLGVVDMPGSFDESFVLADIPGLIEGASDGRGLGHDFLRHLERTAVIVYLVDAFDYEREPIAALEALRAELSAYSADLASKPSFVVLSKTDLAPTPEELEEKLAPLREAGESFMTISSVQHNGLDQLRHALMAQIKDVREAEQMANEANAMTPPAPPAPQADWHA